MELVILIMYKGINEFQKGHQPRALVIKKDDGRIEPDATSILSRWKHSIIFD